MDSDPERRIGLCTALSALGLPQVFGAANSDEAYEIGKAGPVDLCVVDIRPCAEASMAESKFIPPNPFNPSRTPAILIAEDSILATRKAAGRAGYAVVLAASVAPRLLYRRIGWLLQRTRRIARKNANAHRVIAAAAFTRAG